MLHSRGALPGMDPLPDGLPFIILFLPFADGDLKLDETFFEIDRQRDDGVAFLRRETLQAIDFRALEQKFSRAGGIRVRMTLDMRVGRDVAIEKESLPAHNADETIFQIDPPFADGFDFKTEQTNSRLEFILNEIIKAGFAVGGDNIHELRAAGRGS